MAPVVDGIEELFRVRRPVRDPGPDRPKHVQGSRDEAVRSRGVRLPPLNALRVFHAVMRHRSFRNAANELFVTPQAVSQQIKLLEDTLGVLLFDRRGRAIEPTEDAILLAHYVQSGFDEFQEGVRRICKTGPSHQINLNASPYFATRYLLDRLDRFRDRLPEADIRLKTMVEVPDFVRDEIDVAIQWGFGQWRDYEATLLVRDPKVICCAPARAETLRGPDDLRRSPLLHLVLAPGLWGRIVGHLGVAIEEIENRIQVHDAASMRRATLAGLGVGLISMLDAMEDLQAGRLVAPFGPAALAGMAPDDVPGFYLVLPRANRRVKSVTAFCDWALSEDWSQRPE
ncbi:LysR substrate-binding domain-containing protein [Methylobacterium sp. SyP6R]|uniref:LysR substrate-binding domain-containing protein n=1 Tax=Methylobacterium sp. SyP6R TaxID=2718876 RepID=UPI001F3A2F88|nr:LysR substrate-binding domain-containing protein [Methylobacterium sp. SyP6R]MCF4129500.1 LysR substrate-binding domain-containing protein [Methylobacterium sp. SyP6R]